MRLAAARARTAGREAASRTEHVDLNALRVRLAGLLAERDLAWDALEVGEVHPGGPVTILVRLSQPRAALDIDVTAPTVEEAIAEFVIELAHVSPEARWQ